MMGAMKMAEDQPSMLPLHRSSVEEWEERPRAGDVLGQSEDEQQERRCDGKGPDGVEQLERLQRRQVDLCSADARREE